MKKDSLRQECKKLMVDHGYFGHGAKKTLSETLGISYGSFIMALSEYREGPKYVQIRESLRSHLSEAFYSAP
jgi:hypothetical protein